MVGKTEPILAADRERFEIITTYCGCLPCLLMGVPNVHATIQHVVAGKRLGHQYTWGGCVWHHLGYTSDPYCTEEMRGPSLAFGRTPFEDCFGTEESLVELQDYFLARYHDEPWMEYNVPILIENEVRRRWERLTDGERAVRQGPPELPGR